MKVESDLTFFVYWLFQWNRHKEEAWEGWEEKEKAFREKYCKRPDVPVIGLTATATVEEQTDIVHHLGLVNPSIICIPPKKDNQAYFVINGSEKVKLADYNFR